MFKGEKLPQKIKICKAVLTVKPYVANVRLCFKCGKIGHISKFCDKEEACLTCAGNRPKDVNCSAVKKCINCSGPRKTLNRKCPAFANSVAIARIMACDNLPYLKAKKIVDLGKTKIAEVLIKDQKSFPFLPKKNFSFSEATTRDKMVKMQSEAENKAEETSFAEWTPVRDFGRKDVVNAGSG